MATTENDLKAMSCRAKELKKGTEAYHTAFIKNLKLFIEKELARRGVDAITWDLPQDADSYDEDQKKAVLYTTCYCNDNCFVTRNCACPIVGVCKEDDTVKYMVKLVKEQNQPIEKYRMSSYSTIDHRDNVFKDAVHQTYLFNEWVPSLLNKMGIDNTSPDCLKIVELCQNISVIDSEYNKRKDEFAKAFYDYLLEFLRANDGDDACKIDSLTKEEKEKLTVEMFDLNDNYDTYCIDSIWECGDGEIMLTLDNGEEYPYTAGPLLYAQPDLDCEEYYYKAGHIYNFYDVLLKVIKKTKKIS